MNEDMQARTDGELLEAFVERRDEAAYAAIFVRYSKLVYHTCLRALRDEHEAEDACQAVFLVLGQKAKGLYRKNLSGWLYRVAHLTAIEAVRRRERRVLREATYMENESILKETGADEAQAEAVLGVLDSELAKLPGRNRMAVILRYLQGLSQEDAARQAGCSTTSLASRASRGIGELRQRLAGRGMAMNGVALAAMLHAQSQAAVPETLMTSVLSAGKALAAGGLVESVISKSVMTMTKGATKVMFWANVKTAAVTLMTISIFGGGVTLATAVALKADGPGAPGSWPQWRGPNRNGVAPESPALLDKWPTNGPALLWKYPVFHATPMDGGMGSPVVGAGKVVTFFNFHRRIPNDPKGAFVITDEVLKKWMWLPDLPADLAKKFEEAWQSKEVHSARGEKGAEQGKAFAATLGPKIVEKYGKYLEERFKGGPGCEFSWAELTYLASHKNDRYKMVDDFHTMVGKGVGMHHRGGAPEMFEAALKKVFKDVWTDTTICLDAVTGKEVWKKEMPGAQPNFYGAFCAAATPAIANGKCYIMTTSGLFCYSLKDGSVVWQTKTGFVNSAPMLDGGVLYMVVPGGAAAIDANTGKELWKQSKLDVGGNNSLMKWVSGGKNYIICVAGGSGGNLFCLDAGSGEIVWKAPEEGRGSLGEGVYTTPVIVGNDVYVHWGRTRRFAISLQGAVLKGKWNLHGGDRDGSPIVYQGHIYLVQHGSRKCADALTGEIKWMEQNRDIQNSLSSPILADGKIIATMVGGHEGGGKVIMYKASPDKYEQGGIFNPHVVECSSPAFAGGKLYLRCEDSIRCYDLTR